MVSKEFFVGHANDSKAHRIWLMTEKNLVKLRDVWFLKQFDSQLEKEEFICEKTPDKVASKTTINIIKNHSQSENYIDVTVAQNLNLSNVDEPPFHRFDQNELNEEPFYGFESLQIESPSHAASDNNVLRINDNSEELHDINIAITASGVT